MPYADYAFYTAQYKGVEIPEKDFNRLAERASDIVDIVLCNKLEGVDILTLDLFVQKNIKKAVCSQVEYMYTSGQDSLHGEEMSSVRIGNFSYQSSGGDRISPMVYQYLLLTGMLYRGIDCHD